MSCFYCIASLRVASHLYTRYNPFVKHITSSRHVSPVSGIYGTFSSLVHPDRLGRGIPSLGGEHRGRWRAGLGHRRDRPGAKSVQLLIQGRMGACGVMSKCTALSSLKPSRVVSCQEDGRDTLIYRAKRSGCLAHTMSMARA